MNLEEEFKSKKIDFTKVGFYDSPEFINEERKDFNYLSKYAEYVLAKKYSKEYFKKAKDEIPFISKILNEELIKDGRLGACIDTSIVLSRILEKEGFWNYQTKGSLTITFPKKMKLETKYLWTVDTGEFQAGHSWIVAPPFDIIDLTVKQQSYPNKTEKHLPNYICKSGTRLKGINEIDIISPEVLIIMELQGIKSNKLYYVKEDIDNFVETFPVVEILDKGIKFKYSTMAIAAPDEPLERVSTLKLSGRLGIEIYNDIILPKLNEKRNAV